MKFSERVDHLLRQYHYRRKRGSSYSKNKSDFDLDEYLDQIESYISEVIQEIDDILPKRGCK